MGQLTRVETQTLELSPETEQDFDAAMFQREDALPEFLGRTHEEHVSAWAAVHMTAQREHWRLAAIAHSYQRYFGADALKKFAGEVGLKASTVYKYARTYRVFSNPQCERSQSLSFSHHAIAAYQKTPNDAAALLEKAELEHWSVETTREHVRRESFKKQIPESINPDDEYDRQAWERETRPVLYRFIQKCPKFRRQVMYLINEIDGWFKLRTAAPAELIGRAIREGCETAELIAEEIHVSLGAVQVLLDEMVKEGKVRVTKELKVTHDARGATRDRYVWVYPAGESMVDILDADDEEDDEE